MALIYLDTSIVIYLVERHPVYATKVEEALAGAGEATLATSALVRLEALVKPLQDGRADTVWLYQQFLGATRSLPVNDAIFDEALELRVRHRLKTPDALHLAIARQGNCDFIWTNDGRLAQAAGSLNVNILEAIP
jgi:predicted nucleic acid-binding protein